MERTITTPGTLTENQDSENSSWRPAVNAVYSFLAEIGFRIRTVYRRVRKQVDSDILPPINVERITRQLRLIERATEDGRRNLPASDEEAPSAMQREVIAYFRDLRRSAHRQASVTLRAAKNAEQQLDDSDSLASLKEVPARYENQILRHVSDMSARLEYVRERELSQKKHYDAFREKNKLARVATYPDFPFLYNLVVPVLIVGLAIVLTNWIAPGSDGRGLSTGWVLGISTAVILIPFVLGGLSLRAMQHVDDGKYFAGLTGIIAVIAITGMLALYADFYIAAVLGDTNASSRAFFDAMRTAPWEIFSGIASWTTFGLFGLTGLLAVFLGFRADDVYPGFGAVQRAYYRAREDRERIERRLRSRINAMIDEAVAEVTRMTHDYRTKFLNHTNLAHQAALCPTLLKEYDAELEDACNVVLDRYRAANLAARNTEAPFSFDEHICFNTDIRSTAALQESSAINFDLPKAALTTLESEADAVRKKLRSMNLHLIDSTTESHIIDPEE